MSQATSGTMTTQQEACAHLLAYHLTDAVCERLGIAPETMERWQRDPVFLAAFAAAAKKEPHIEAKDLTGLLVQALLNLGKLTTCGIRSVEEDAARTLRANKEWVNGQLNQLREQPASNSPTITVNWTPAAQRGLTGTGECGYVEATISPPPCP